MYVLYMNVCTYVVSNLGKLNNDEVSIGKFLTSVKPVYLYVHGHALVVFLVKCAKQSICCQFLPVSLFFVTASLFYPILYFMCIILNFFQQGAVFMAV